MNIIESANIKGFWGSHEVDLTIHDDLNFLIGPNGSGKSTTLQLIAGVLQADKQLLSRLEFDSVRIVLRNQKTKKKPAIEAVRDKEAPFFKVKYRIFESAGDKPFSYELSEIDSTDIINSLQFGLRMKVAGRDAASKTLRKHLDELLSLTWLSVHRLENAQEARGADPLDKKLEDFSNRLVRYLSSVGKQVNRLHEQFQEQVFLSLLSSDEFNLSEIPSAKEIEKEKSALNQIFSQFQIDKKNYSNKIEKHFITLEAIRKKFASGGSLTNNEIMALFDLNRIERSIQFWETVSEEKRKLLAPRDKFTELLNGLMQRKSLSINERNEINITTQSGKPLTLSQLSSGEKQILIILGEALLQENKTYIYMADEPELSLHVTWQENLATNIKSLNPAAQIIFATHSPDIVGPYGAKIIDMESRIK